MVDYSIPRVVALGVCDQCGEVHQTCTSHPKPHRTDGVLRPCRMPAVTGATVCRMHGGSAPQVRKAGLERAAREEAEAREAAEFARVRAEAEKVVAEMGGVAQLQAAVNRAGTMALAYQWLLDTLPVETVVVEGEDGPTIATRGLIGPDHNNNLVLHPFDEAARSWTKLHGDLLRTAATLGLEERRQAIAQEQVDRIGGAIVSLVEGLGRDLDDPAVVPVVESALRMITEEATA